MTDPTITYKTVTPYLVVSDADAEILFMKKVFAAEETACMRTPEGAVMHAEIRVGDSLVMLGQSTEQWKALSAAIFIWLPEVDATYQRALDAGAESQMAPDNKPYGHRMAGVVDKNGINWWIGSPLPANQ